MGSKDSEGTVGGNQVRDSHETQAGSKVSSGAYTLEDAMMMPEMKTLADGREVALAAWRQVEELVQRDFPDPFGDEGEESQLRERILETISAGHRSTRLYDVIDLSPDDKLKLRKIDEVAQGLGVLPV